MFLDSQINFSHLAAHSAVGVAWLLSEILFEERVLPLLNAQLELSKELPGLRPLRSMAMAAVE